MTKRTAVQAHLVGQARTHAIAAKKIIVQHLNKAITERRKTKRRLAQELRTSRSQLARLLDPENTAVSLETIARAAGVLGKRIVFAVEDIDDSMGVNSRKSKKSIMSISAEAASPSEIEEAAS